MDPDQNNADQINPGRRNHRRRHASAYTGIWLIVIGVLFLLNNFGLFAGDVWGKLWPIFIIVPGLFMILRPWRH